MQPTNAQMATLIIGFMDRATVTGIKEHEAYAACLRWLHEFTQEKDTTVPAVVKETPETKEKK